MPRCLLTWRPDPEARRTRLQPCHSRGYSLRRHIMHPRAAYVHVPFCAHRCGYCNFTVVAGRNDLVDRYLEAIERELSWLDGPREVDTLFLGGGTPSHLPPEKLRHLLDLIRRSFPPAAGYEFTVEANPSDLDGPLVQLRAGS